MIEVGIGFIISAFIAGLLTFLAPCTLPLVPAYLGFISGVSTKELEDPATADKARKKVFKNSLFFVLGFSIVFILFGTLAGVLGQSLVPFREWLAIIGGLLVIFFGLFMLGLFNVRWLQGGSALTMPSWMHAGNVSSSFLVGGAFAFGWTPCVGPILGSILLLASTEGSAITGALLLSVFSLGLALPFIIISLALTSASRRITAFFAFLTRQRVSIFVLFGIVLGLLTNVVLMALATVSFLAPLFVPLSAVFATSVPWLLPLVVAGVLGFISYKKRTIDVLGVLGGLFLVALGLLLTTGSFGFLVQFGFEFFSFFGYEGLLEYL